MKKVAVIDYSMGNLDSLCRAIEKCGKEAVRITCHKESLREVSHIILPGVGSYKQAIENLEHFGLKDLILEAVNRFHLPLLGVCLGMQLLSEVGYEHGYSNGLGLIPGEVIPFNNTHNSLRTLHIGWNEVKQIRKHDFFYDIPDGEDFYFVHKYFFKAEDAYILATTEYGNTFPSVVYKDNIYGVQFHPEKSQKEGLKMIKNFLNIVG